MVRAGFLFASLMLAGGLFLARAQQSNAPRASVAQIEALIRSHDLEQALRETKSALAASPRDFRLWTLEGIIYSIWGNNSDALAAFARALRISPGYAPALKGEVQLLYPSGDKRAIPLLKEILKADAHGSTAHEMLAMLQKKQGDCQAAVDQFSIIEGAIATHPASLEAYGDCLNELKQYDKAIPVFQQLVALLPGQTFPKYDLAVILVTAKQNDAAIKVLEPLLKADQSDPDILSLASEAYEAVGDTPKAVALLRQAIVLSPATASYYVAFAELCLDHDSFQVGIDMINAGLHRIPANPSLYLSRGLLYAQLAQYDKAEADFGKAEQLDASGSLSFYAVDLTEMQKNDPDKALAQVRVQLKTHPESPLLNLLLAELLMNQTPPAESPTYREALRSVELAVRLKPDLVKAHDLLADMYMRSSQYNLAVEQCRTALRYSPSDEAAMYHLIISLRHEGGYADELPPLVKRLAEMHQESLKAETGRKKFRLEEQQPPPASVNQ
jgi:tetratricopeptide (TPR) repeat protein